MSLYSGIRKAQNIGRDNLARVPTNVLRNAVRWNEQRMLFDERYAANADNLRAYIEQREGKKRGE